MKTGPQDAATIAEMKRRMDPLPANLRPHAKIHKSPMLGRMQLDAGAVGLTTATVWEASAMIDAGLSRLLIANQAVGPHKAAELARLGGLAEVIVAVESAANAEEISAAARDAGTEVGALVEFDVGLHRSGVRTVPEAVDLGGLVEKLPDVNPDPLGLPDAVMIRPSVVAVFDAIAQPCGKLLCESGPPMSSIRRAKA